MSHQILGANELFKQEPLDVSHRALVSNPLQHHTTTPVACFNSSVCRPAFDRFELLFSNSKGYVSRLLWLDHLPFPHMRELVRKVHNRCTMCTNNRLTTLESFTSSCAQIVRFVHICMKTFRGDVSYKIRCVSTSLAFKALLE